MKEEFPSLAENAETKTRRYVERTRLSALRQVCRSTLPGSGSVVGLLKIIHLDEQSASRRSDLLVQLLRTWVTLIETRTGSLVAFRAVRRQTGGNLTGTTEADGNGGSPVVQVFLPFISNAIKRNAQIVTLDTLVQRPAEWCALGLCCGIQRQNGILYKSFGTPSVQ
jgi:hypothetical protein